MRETLRQHLLESRARVFVPSLGGHRTLRILLCVFSEMTVTASTKADPFGPLKQNRLSRFELSVSLISGVQNREHVLPQDYETNLPSVIAKITRGRASGWHSDQHKEV